MVLNDVQQTAILLLLLGIGLYVPVQEVGAVPDTIVDLIVNEEYEAAQRKLDDLQPSPDRLFAKAYLYYKRKDYLEAKRLFLRLQERYPENTRSKDAKFFLKSIKLEKPRNTTPSIGVLLSEASLLNGKVSGKASIQNSAGKTITDLEDGDEWSVELNYENQPRLSVNGHGISVSGANSLLLKPASEDGKLLHNGTHYRGEFLIRKSRGADRLTLVNELPINHYLFGVVRKEIAPNWPIEVIKAQSVAARSFAVAKLLQEKPGPDIKSSHLAQVYGGWDAETKNVRKAVRATQGEVLSYSGKPIQAYFHANSGGYIENAQNVWAQSKTPYIVPKPDPWSKNTRHSTWESTIKKSFIEDALSKSQYRAPARTLDIRVEDSLSSGRAKKISYRTENTARDTLSANKFRMAIGPGKIKSTWFTSIRENAYEIIFKGKGWGHGVGMSQWGAKKMSEENHSYREILKFYYERAKLIDQYGMTAQ